MGDHFVDDFGRSIGAEDLADCFFENFVAAGADTFDSWKDCFVRFDSDLLSGLSVGIKNSDAADHSAETAGKWNRRHISIGTGSRTADDRGVRRGAQGHGCVLSVAL